MEPGDFKGTIGRYHWESEPHWPESTRAPKDAPNVMIVLLDDVGYAQLAPYGSDIDTPTIDRLAAGGLTFTNYHTTALCSPTRACVLTGRNHHSVGMGRITDLATGFPGYDATISHRHGFLSEMLEPQGWATYGIGKWHLTPRIEQHLGASRRRWPLGRGFQRYYGFMEGETNHFGPTLIHDNHQVEPPEGDDYHFTEDMANKAIEWLTDLRNADGDKPFFLYFATGACHSPHQAPPSYLEAYKGRFNLGWDRWRAEIFERQRSSGLLPDTTELSPRPDWVPAWDDLSDDERRVCARYMEAFAAMLTHTDAQIGRVIDHLEATGELDNTIVLVMSDNGASSEGGPSGSLNDLRTWNIMDTPLAEAIARIDEIGGPSIHNNYPWGWTVAGNTPFRRWKREVNEGGVADPFIVHWPDRIAGGGRRNHYCHAIDITPTILQACGVTAPGTIGGNVQSPIEGTSILPAIDDASHAEFHTTQYYEMFGCRAIYHEGYKAVTYHQIHVAEPGLDAIEWELYDVRVDPSECHDLAAEMPDKVAELDALFWHEAENHQVLPLDNRPFSEFTTNTPRGPRERKITVLLPGGGEIPEETAPDIKNRPHRVSAYVTTDAEPHGVLISQGSVLGGWVLYVDDGQLIWHLNIASRRSNTISAPLDIEPGDHVFEFDFATPGDMSGVGRLYIDGTLVATDHVRFFTPTRFTLTGVGLTVGRANVLPVCEDAGAASPFNGVLSRVVVELDGEAWSDPEADAEAAIAAQ